jgi:hypothetical protein
MFPSPRPAEALSSRRESLLIGYALCRTRTGDPFLTMEVPGTAILPFYSHFHSASACRDWRNLWRFVRFGGEVHRGSWIVMPAQQR